MVGIGGLAIWVAFLAAAGCVATRSSGPTASPLSGTFNYTKTDGAFLVGGAGKYEVLVPQLREVWIGRDGSGRVRTALDAPTYFGDRDRAEWQGNPEIAPHATDHTASSGFVFVDVSGLPRDPATLRVLLLEEGRIAYGSAGPAAYELLTAARDVLWETVPPADLSRTVLSMLINEGDFEVVRGAADLIGRPAISFSATTQDGELRSVIWLDQATGALLGETRELLLPRSSIDAAPPVAIMRATYLESAIVDTTRDR